MKPEISLETILERDTDSDISSTLDLDPALLSALSRRGERSTFCRIPPKRA